MTEEDLMGSHWDDAVSSNLGFSSQHIAPPSPSNEFADLSLNKVEEEDVEANDESEVIVDATVPVEDKKMLLSELIAGADDNPLSAFSNDGKVDANESLFKDKETSSNLPSVDLEESSKITPVNSPTKVSSIRGNKLFNTPRRPRKYQSKNLLDNLAAGEIGQSPDPLGPLGGSNEDSLDFDHLSPDKSESRAESLKKAAEAPLYQLKKNDGAEVYAIPKPQLNVPVEIEGDNKEPPIKLEITVGDPVKVGELTNAHIVYSLRTKTNSKLFANEENIVSRRYRDFRWIYHQLQNNHQGSIIPPPPSKQAVGRFDENFIENRRLSLERMLYKISSTPLLRDDADFVMFLSSENFVHDSREREHISGSDASKQSDEYLDNDLASVDSSNSSGGGFMSALGNAFSLSKNYVETDDYFKEKKAYINQLESHLKSFMRSLENILQQRSELSGLVLEISNISEELSELEISKNTTELLAEFSSVHARLKDILDRTNLQDMLTLGFTIEEYLRIIGSIKATFQQRIKAHTDYYNMDQELIKRQGSLDKFQRKYRNQTDKIDMMGKEIEVLEGKSLNLRVNFENLSNTIRKELERFEFEKIDDFRNSVETYLESSIEAQKESIELWETFYERQNLDKV